MPQSVEESVIDVPSQQLCLPLTDWLGICKMSQTVCAQSHL